MQRLDTLLRGGTASSHILRLGILAVFLIYVCSHAAAQRGFGEGVPWQPKPQPMRQRTIAKTTPAAAKAKPAGYQPGKFSSDDRSMMLTSLPDPYTESWPNTVAICAIMFNETARDVKEFIEYYRWLGVDSFYIRENSRTSSVGNVLRPFQNAGIVNYALHPGPKFPFQTNWYNECSKLAAKKHSWIAFIDMDEFMVILKKGVADSEQGALKRVLRDRFRYNAAVSLQWVLFGSSGHKEPPPNGQLDGFRKCTGDLSKQMKCIGNTYWLNHIRTFAKDMVHQCSFRVGGIAAIANGDPMPMKSVNVAPGTKLPGRFAMSYPGHMYPNLHARYTEITEDYRIVINHYVTRSQNRFIERKIRIKAGVYATTYAEILKKRGGRGSQDELFAAFEKEYGFDGEYPICGQGAASAAAMRAAIKAGTWHPINSSPGLLPRPKWGGSG